MAQLYADMKFMNIYDLISIISLQKCRPDGLRVNDEADNAE